MLLQVALFMLVIVIETVTAGVFGLKYDDHDDDHDVDDDKDGDVDEGTGGEPGADHSVGDSVNIRQFPNLG